MSIENCSALLIGMILLLVGVLSALFPESEDDKPGHKNWKWDELWK
jgi:hypothetical protein